MTHNVSGPVSVTTGETFQANNMQALSEFISWAILHTGNDLNLRGKYWAKDGLGRESYTTDVNRVMTYNYKNVVNALSALPATERGDFTPVPFVSHQTVLRHFLPDDEEL